MLTMKAMTVDNRDIDTLADTDSLEHVITNCDKFYVVYTEEPTITCEVWDWRPEEWTVIR